MSGWTAGHLAEFGYEHEFTRSGEDGTDMSKQTHHHHGQQKQIATADRPGGFTGTGHRPRNWAG